MHYISAPCFKEHLLPVIGSLESLWVMMLLQMWWISDLLPSFLCVADKTVVDGPVISQNEVDLWLSTGRCCICLLVWSWYMHGLLRAPGIAGAGNWHPGLFITPPGTGAWVPAPQPPPQCVSSQEIISWPLKEMLSFRLCQSFIAFWDTSRDFFCSNTCHLFQPGHLY